MRQKYTPRLRSRLLTQKAPARDWGRDPRRRRHPGRARKDRRPESERQPRPPAREGAAATTLTGRAEAEAGGDGRVFRELESDDHQ